MSGQGKNMSGNGTIWKSLLTVVITVIITLVVNLSILSSQWGDRTARIAELENKVTLMGSFAERLATVEERLRFSIDENKSAHASIEAKLNILLEKAFARYQITDAPTYQAMYWSEDYICTLVSGVTYQ